MLNSSSSFRGAKTLGFVFAGILRPLEDPFLDIGGISLDIRAIISINVTDSNNLVVVPRLSPRVKNNSSERLFLKNILIDDVSRSRFFGPPSLQQEFSENNISECEEGFRPLTPLRICG